MANVCNAAIVGARGYSGLELARLLLSHPGVRLAATYGSDASSGSGWRLSDALSGSAAAQVPSRAILGIEVDVSEMALDVVFLATPPEASLELTPKLLKAGARVIDLSAAYRDCAQASYGLVPWCGPLAPGVKLIANPGCYVTAVLMALIPLLKESLIDSTSIVIDAKSGATGAGKKTAENLLFSEVADECRPYRVGSHQHVPEIARYLQAYAGVTVDPWFTPHLLPIRRGILASIYAKAAGVVGIAQIQAAYARAYGGYGLLEHAALETEGSPLLSLKRVVGTPRTQIAYAMSGARLSVFASIDNLLKGAASQAVENLNRLLDLPVDTGLNSTEVYGNGRPTGHPAANVANVSP